MQGLVIHTAALLSLGLGQSRLDCRTDTLNTCIRLAEPLLEQPSHVFPDTQQDIDHVCNVLFPKTWSEFVTCIKRYTSDCLTPDQRADFNRAVGDSINSVHKMCTNLDYKNDYLGHAACIKERSTGEVYCGQQYRDLTALVRGDRSGSQRELCCAHTSFRDCVVQETAGCGGRAGGGGLSAQQFARAMLDKSLGFLMKQCQDYSPARADCPGYRPPARPADKQPRFEDTPVTEEAGRYDDGMYFPSGAPGREERRQEDGWVDQGWVDRPAVLEEGGLGEEQLSTDSSQLEPVRTPAPVALQPSSEQERPRRPWLPSLDTEIQSFDDIFSNAINEPQGRTGGAGRAGGGALLLLLVAAWLPALL